jgi:hypothetical protein
MDKILTRMFLLLLLMVDWYTDPYQGTSPLSRPMASQEAYCHSLDYREAMDRESSPDFSDFSAPHACIETLTLPEAKPISGEPHSSLTSGVPLRYLFMVLLQ